jgi:hypothetical protein
MVERKKTSIDPIIFQAPNSIQSSLDSQRTKNWSNTLQNLVTLKRFDVSIKMKISLILDCPEYFHMKSTFCPKFMYFYAKGHDKNPQLTLK